MRCYIALLTEDAANRYRIVLPDFPGCEAWSGALADVRGIAERLLAEELALRAAAGEPVPRPTAPEWLLDMPFNPRVLMENITRQELVDMYAEYQGRAVPDMLFYYVFGTFKIAVIAQQIFARYVRGFTRDARFATFNTFVAALGRIADTAIKRGSI